jgi:3-oxoacyl-[acyl-carrier protein] reductase
MAKTVLITGASTGIGAEAAKRLAPGNKIIIHYNASQKAAQSVAETVHMKSGDAYLVQADLTSAEGCGKLFATVSEMTSKLDVLVNSAGGAIVRRNVHEIDWEFMQKTFALNTFSTMEMTKRCLTLLEKGENPCIINITSVAMRSGAPTLTTYAASKGAIDTFTRGAAKELAPLIRVNAVAPGVIETPFHEKISTSQKMQEFRNATPLGRNGRAEDIAKVIQLLVEDRFMTGETIDVNGGLFMH